MKTINLIKVLLIIPLIILACSKDDNENIESPTSKGTLTIHGIEYELTQGIIYKRTEKVGPVYNFDVDLFSSGMNVETETGSGQLVAMEMFTDTPSDLKTGAYTHDSNGTYPAGTFGGNILVGYNIETENISTWYITTSGTIVSARSGSMYEFTMDIKADEFEVSEELGFVKVDSNVVITCYYKGNLTKKDFK